MTGGCLNRRLRRFSQMGYDSPLPFVVLGSRLRERGKWVLCFSLGSRLRGNDGGVCGNDGGGGIAADGL